jgi:hypothetical protein
MIYLTNQQFFCFAFASAQDLQALALLVSVKLDFFTICFIFGNEICPNLLCDGFTVTLIRHSFVDTP